VHAAAAEARRLAGREQTGNRGAAVGERARLQVRLDSAQRLAGEHVQLHSDERAGRGIQDAVRLGGPDEPVAPIGARRAEHRHLRVLRERVADLAVARLHLAAHPGGVEGVAAREVPHPVDERVERVAHDEVLAAVEERLHGSGRALPEPRADQERHVLPGEVRVLLAAGERELLLHDAVRQHEPRVVVAGAAQVRERPERVEAREQRHGQPRARRVEPDRGRTGEDADTVAGPDRVPVPDALHVVPHAIAVDEPCPGVLSHAQHRSVDVGGHARDQGRGRRAEPRGPELADQIVVPADAARGDDRRARLDLERADDVARGHGAPGRPGCREDLAGRTRDGTVAGGERGHAVAGEDRQAPRGLRLLQGTLERADERRPGAPHDVEARDRVARPVGRVAAALGPAHHREEPDPELAQPRALLTGRERDVRLRPPAGPRVLLAVEAGGPEPVLLREGERVADAHAALLGRVDEEQPAERPPRLAAQVAARGLVDDRHAAPGADRLVRGDEAGEAPSDHEHVGAVRCGHPRLLDSVVGAPGP
jgi:hypothetical protein